jgi:DNA-binding beta-propeller fold protein YncE
MRGAHEAPTVVDHLGSRSSGFRQAVTLAALMAVSAVGMLAIAQPPSAEARVADSVGTLSIFAGTGTDGAATAGPATSSNLNYPTGVAVDSSGNVYIADYSNNVVEKVTPSGTLSVFAGTGTDGAPTAGPATSSNLNGPTGVAVDSSGNVYIADNSNHRIEKVTPSGTLSVFAGTGTKGAPTAGPATSSNLNDPTGVAVDSSGNVYIADQSGKRVVKVKPDGTLSVFAGTGTAGAPTAGPATSSNLNNPAGVAVDSSGNVYIADKSNNLVEKVTPDGTLSVFAGTGTQGSPTPGVATSSKLYGPTGVAVDSSGNVYIADRSNELVLKVTPSGTLSVFAGTGTQGAPIAGPATSSNLNHAFGVAVDSSGNVYIVDSGNNLVEKVTNAHADTTAPSTPGSFSGVPASSTTESSVTIGFTLGEASGTVECKLDAGSWGACTSISDTSGSITLTGLAAGSHSLSVRQTDAAGNVSNTGTSASWSVVRAPFLAPSILTPASDVKTVYKTTVNGINTWAIKTGLLFSTGGDTRSPAQLLTVQVAVGSNGKPVSTKPSDTQPAPTVASFTNGVVAWSTSGEVTRSTSDAPVWVRVGNKAGKWSAWVKLTA